VRLFCLNPAEVDAVWEDIGPALDRQCDLTEEQLKTNLKTSKMQLWGIQTDTEVQGICITEILQTSRGLICLIVSARGSGIRKPLMERLHDEIGKWAKGLGCIALRIHGRKGWLRWDRRYRQTGIVAERCL
jgi:hypothetical protein